MEQKKKNNTIPSFVRYNVFKLFQARSPVFAHVTASMQGLPTIRACKAEQVLIKEFDNYQVGIIYNFLFIRVPCLISDSLTLRIYIRPRGICSLRRTKRLAFGWILFASFT